MRAVEIGRIEALPPRALARGLQQGTVVGYALQRAIPVAAVCRLIPTPGTGGVDGNAESQAMHRALLAHMPIMSFFGPTFTEFQG